MDFINKQNKNKNKISQHSNDAYMERIYSKCCEPMKNNKPSVKITDDNIIIPNIRNYTDLLTNNYTLSQLKIFAKHYKLKTGGNKTELNFKIYSHLYLYSKIVHIQKIFRGSLVKKYNLLHGPASLNKKLCTNSTDFITMEPLEDINYHQFISYKDEDGFIYGFDLTSIYNLYAKSGINATNPYNRTKFPVFIFENIKKIIQLSKIMNVNINLNIEDETKNVSDEKAVEFRTLNLFQMINSLGNYSEPQWFLSLNRQKMIKLIRELADIWNYRAQLSIEVKRNICPPSGDPFRNLSFVYINTEENMTNVRKAVLTVLEKLVNDGVDTDSKSLGAYYVLGALTLVNDSAASSLPWLFQSVNYFN